MWTRPCYGETPHPQTDAPDAERDKLESRLLREALERDVPVLAICRGMQLFNVEHGGSLVQHLENAGEHRVIEAPHAHQISVEEGTQLAAAMGAGPHAVNSRHHQAVAKLGNSLRVAASSADGVIEAIERPDRRFAVAVQWHPEDLAGEDGGHRALFEAFAKAL